MAKSVIEVKVTELDVVKELVNICTEFYLDMPEDMRIRYDEWRDKLKEVMPEDLRDTGATPSSGGGAGGNGCYGEGHEGGQGGDGAYTESEMIKLNTHHNRRNWIQGLINLVKRHL